jgi:predicted phage terminase large subunit-like protein
MDHGSKPKPVWPEYWKLDELEKVQATLPVAKWNAQWMQNPTAEEGAILKREWWRTYTGEEIPQLQHVIQSYDTAFLKKETADYSAITTWGIFYPIEAKASGLPLTYELRRMDIPVVNFTPSKGNDKHARVNAVAPLFESGMIWAPEQKFAEEVIEECAAFPYGDHDDLVDSTTQAIMRFRQGGLIDHPEDYVDEKAEKPKRNYY